MRRRRRRKHLWLPNQGIAGAAGGVAQAEAMWWDEFSLSVPASGLVNTQILDTTFDFPVDTSMATVTVQTPMSDFIRSGYYLRRIVGSVFARLDTTSGGIGAFVQGAAITYGVFVARADETADNAIPIGALTGNEIDQNYSPQNNENVREPWIFLRSWILGSRLGATSLPGSGAAIFPPNNSFYGSAFEGSFVDQKTMRRIGPDERLWHVVSVRHYPLRVAHDGAANVVVNTALRYLGRPAPTRNRGTF